MTGKSEKEASLWRLPLAPWLFGECESNTIPPWSYLHPPTEILTTAELGFREGLE